MHRLVQLTVRTWLKAHGQLEQWKGLFIENLYSKFPTAEYENWERYRSLFPHMKVAVSQRPESPVSVQQWATLLYRGAWYAQESGYITESMEMAYRSRKYRLKVFGAENEEALESTAMLAGAYQLVGRWEEAEQLFVQVMETRKSKLGADHPDTLTSMANLASTFWYQGRWEEAEQLFMQVMETRKAKLGADHPSTLTSMGNLASTLWNQGRWEEAEQLEVQVMETRKAKLGADHPDTLTSMANLAFTLESTGRRSEAIDLLRICVAKQQRILGPAHPDTVSNSDTLLAWETGDVAIKA
ncbi:Tetratricopeptide-like helical [Penicillium daleae]|uniref:Tetratricopeptide-like helical n=1 Tax=Penicillium daleae TaxID=63821 RepID=A0AAD6CGV2_9EURO|nr:Tetratricopeptide-like helical [Penicillium daleae]KAJ5464918.1 Tetratricopeptide-like helical [Penicillium daleae]